MSSEASTQRAQQRRGHLSGTSDRDKQVGEAADISVHWIAGPARWDLKTKPGRCKRPYRTLTTGILRSTRSSQQLSFLPVSFLQTLLHHSYCSISSRCQGRAQGCFQQWPHLHCQGTSFRLPPKPQSMLQWSCQNVHMAERCAQRIQYVQHLTAPGTLQGEKEAG